MFQFLFHLVLYCWQVFKLLRCHKARASETNTTQRLKEGLGFRDFLGGFWVQILDCKVSAFSLIGPVTNHGNWNSHGDGRTGWGDNMKKLGLVAVKHKQDVKPGGKMGYAHVPFANRG